MHGALGGLRLQLRFYLAYPDLLIPVFTSPLFAVIFIAILRDQGRDDLSGYAVVAPILMGLWWFTLFHAGWLIQNDRWHGTLEQLLAAPSHFAHVVIGRIGAVAVAGLFVYPEVILFANLVLGAGIEVHHPLWLVVAVLATAFAMAATGVFLACVFVLTRNSATFANAASYPFYILGGIIVPLALLPSWVHPVGGLVFLSWAADLLRASLAPGPMEEPWTKLGMLLALTAFWSSLGLLAVRHVLNRVRVRGDLATQ